jgi:hypothetical protein
LKLWLKGLTNIISHERLMTNQASKKISKEASYSLGQRGFMLIAGPEVPKAVGYVEPACSEVQQFLETITDAEREAFEERAGIMEYDGGLSRDQAEREAMKTILKQKQGGKK